MREITFTWGGKELRLTPTMALLHQLANDVRRATEGSETTVSLAFKCVNGGLEPLFMLVPIRAFLSAVLTKEEMPTDEEIFTRLQESPGDVMSFRMAYVQAILPNVSLGKDRAAPLPVEAGGLKMTRKERRAKKSTSKPSTSSPG